MISRARWGQPRVIDTLIPTPLLSFGPGGFGPGDHTDETILVNLPTLQETRLLIYGTSGSGKTTALYALLQQTYGAVQHIIVDKEGSFPKLREHFDYLLVSGDGEVPIDLSPGAVEVVLRKILETRVNAIIDLSDLVPSDQHEYVRRMATMMAHLSIKSPLAEHDKLVLVDEFQHFAPERGQGNASSTEAMMQLASLARKRGFCLVGATTRISLLSKSIVEMMDNKMIGRCGLDDAARAAQWLNFTKGQRRELSNLSTGTFYAFGPAISPDPVLVRSQSDLLVLPPRRGERRSTPATPAAVRDVLGAFDDIAREAETEARTIEELQTQVDTLTRQLRKAEKATAASRRRRSGSSSRRGNSRGSNSRNSGTRPS
jgi:DNA helicase HerA-like ATPase